jgi:hypothetical protein
MTSGGVCTLMPFPHPTLGHFRFQSDYFGITAKIRDVADSGSDASPEARFELLVAVLLCALELSLDNTPRQTKRDQEGDVKPDRHHRQTNQRNILQGIGPSHCFRQPEIIEVCPVLRYSPSPSSLYPLQAEINNATTTRRKIRADTFSTLQVLVQI